jgi:hypothetical protein
MRYSKISITKKAVLLERETVIGKSIETTNYESQDKPLGSFVDAMQAFGAYLIALLADAVTIAPENLTITTLNFSEDKNGYLGLIVTGTLPVKKAYDKPLVLNTPLVREGSEEASADAFVLSDEVLELIDLVEAEAIRYEKGERVQLELMPKAETTSENTAAFNERAAAAEVATTRKPKSARGKGKPETAADAEAASQTWNPGKTEPLTTPLLRQLLLSVERDVPEDAIERWTSSERDGAQRWAEARQQEILGQWPTDRMPREPECVIKASDASLADGWTEKNPPRPDAAGVESIKTAAGATPEPTRSHPFVH